jgi:glycosyltransferase involved in cell wall biosynthesis
LTPPEQGFIFARIEEKDGGHPLRLSPHYPPREVAKERFPSPRLPASRLPKITVVTPSFQQGQFLEATVRSVLDQEGVRLDYIVQDGGSTDGTAEVLRCHAPRLKHWASERDRGQGDALRRGFARMEAGDDDVMAYLNSDDLLMPGAARFVAEYFARHPEVDVVYGHRVLIDEAGREVGRWLAPRRSCDDLRMQDLIPQETLFWRKRIWDRVGGIDPRFQFALDWDLLLRFAAAGARISRLPWFLGLFRLHPHQKSQARLEEVGIPEMDRLRERSLGRPPLRAELVASMQRAQIDSTLLRTWMKRGWRF